MQKNYKWVVVIGVVILGALLIWQIQKPGATEYNESKQGESSEDSIQKNSEIPVVTPTPTSTGSGSSGQTSGKLSYGEAIKKYQYRIQFVNCHGNPGTVSLKRNLPLMLDNRDDKAHTLKVAGKSYYIKAYDYALAYIGSEGTYNLTCDGGGAATVNIEK
jgi:hypothetical protein